MSLLRRIARLMKQSRIRLPARPIVAAELRPGDWVQLGSERLRVVDRHCEADRVVFRLRPHRGSLDAVLVAPRQARGDWTLERGGCELSFAPELLVVFPVV